MDKIGDIKRLRADVGYKLSLKTCKETYESCGCDIEAARERLFSMLDEAIVDNSRLIEESKERFEKREKRRKKRALAKKIIFVFLAMGLLFGCYYSAIVVENGWIVLLSVTMGMLGMCLLFYALFPRFVAWLKRLPIGVNAERGESEPKNRREKSDIIGNIFAAGAGMADGFKEGWNKNREKENVWEDNSEDNDWLPEDE